jgi:tRNA threonylcarbamoyladenosine biosynthesis protein TsaB
MIQDAMKASGTALNDLDCIAVTRGPGSFTGLRIGLAAARGFGLALTKPVIGVSRFDLYFQAFLTHTKDSAVIIESKRAELYVQHYSNGKAQDAFLADADEIAARYRDKEIALAGDGAVHLKNKLAAAFLELDRPEAFYAAEMAAKMKTGQPENLPRPLYIRAPDVTFPKRSHAG